MYYNVTVEYELPDDLKWNIDPSDKVAVVTNLTQVGFNNKKANSVNAEATGINVKAIIFFRRTDGWKITTNRIFNTMEEANECIAIQDQIKAAVIADGRTWEYKIYNRNIIEITDEQLIDIFSSLDTDPPPIPNFQLYPWQN